MARKGIIYKPFRIEEHQHDPDDSDYDYGDQPPPPLPPPPPARRPSIFARGAQLLTRTTSRDDGGGQQRDEGGGGGFRKRSRSAPPDDGNHSRQPQDRHRNFAPANAQNTGANPRPPGRSERDRTRGVQDPRRRGRRNSEAKVYPTHAPAPPTLLRFPPSPPVTPGDTTAGETRPRKVLRRNSRARPKIFFYDKNEPHYGFTNFSPHPVKYRGKMYPTSEHIYQSLKFVHRPKLMEHIRTCDPRPRVAFKEARKFAHEIDPNWKYSRVTSMYSALINKFDQHDDLRRELIDTGDAELIQASHRDYFWGCGSDGTGENKLGECLMRIRKLFREQERL